MYGVVQHCAESQDTGEQVDVVETAVDFSTASVDINLVQFEK